MIKISATSNHATPKGDAEVVLINDKNHPTPAMFGLLALELAADISIAYAAYQLMKKLKGN